MSPNATPGEVAEKTVKRIEGALQAEQEVLTGAVSQASDEVAESATQ